MRVLRAPLTVLSPRFQLIAHDLVSALKGLAIVMAGAALTYILELVGRIDFGQFSPLIVAVLSFLINLGRKWVSEHSYLIK